MGLVLIRYFREWFEPFSEYRDQSITLSPDGGSLAVICTDSNGDTLQLVKVDLDGRLVGQLSEDDTMVGAPTWAGDGRIVYVRDVKGDGTTTLWAISSDGGAQAEQITNGLDGSDSHPDWSNQGLLFLRTQGGTSKVLYRKSLADPGVTTIWSGAKMDAPTWAPRDEAAVVWLEPAKVAGEKTLWGMALDGTSPKKGNSGAFGPPAWGSR